MATGCGKFMIKFVSRGYTYKELKVRCGNTRPDGFPYQCDECERRNRFVDWRMEAKLNGENLDSEY